MTRAKVGSAVQGYQHPPDDRQVERLRALRADLTAALASAEEAMYRREAPINVALALHRRLEGMLTRWRS